MTAHIRAAFDRPKRPTIDPKLKARLEASNAMGLLDTLMVVAGREAPDSIVALPWGRVEEGVLGERIPGGVALSLADAMKPSTNPEDPSLLVETLIHEFGHVVGGTHGKPVGRVPSVERAHGPIGRAYNPDAAARAFTRAVMALRETAQDTTGADRLLELYEQGYASALSTLERGERPGTIRVLAELLGLEPYRQHPLQSRRERYLREASSLR